MAKRDNPANPRMDLQRAVKMINAATIGMPPPDPHQFPTLSLESSQKLEAVIEGRDTTSPLTKAFERWVKGPVGPA